MTDPYAAPKGPFEAPMWVTVRERTATQAGIVRKAAPGWGGQKWVVQYPYGTKGPDTTTVMQSRAEAFAKSIDVEEDGQ
ncbi:MAG: hypothetical protein DRJ50_04065 [Actinobacteria bacterium]|nr:MAG: hypothetical protein DRJ50_04065 [Actinomycetota bacterium]